MIGSVARAAVTGWLGASTTGFPIGVLAVNLAGSVVIGLYVTRRERSVSAPWSLPFWAIGLVGSFTTFSTFAGGVVQLLVEGEPRMAAFYTGASVLGGLAAVGVGQRIGAVVR